MADPATQNNQAPTRIEKRSSRDRFLPLLILAGLLALAVAIILYAKRHIDIQTEPSYAGTLPKSGSIASISDIQTGWKKLKNTSSQAGEQLYPSATITLGKDSPKPSGSLLITFYSPAIDSPKEYIAVGDTLTVNYHNGLFDNGEAHFTVTGTASIGILANFLTYRDQDDVRWKVEIRESDGSSEFEELGHAPIDPEILP